MELSTQTQILSYLKNHNICYDISLSEGLVRISLIIRNQELCPNQIIESSLWFHSDCLEVKTYYTRTGSEWCKNNKNKHPDLFRLINYINKNIWLNLCDGSGQALYNPCCLYTPRLSMSEDEGDIAITTVIPYDFFLVAPIESCDYFTAFCPEFLNKLSPAIFFLLLGKFDYVDSKNYIEKTLLK